MRFHNIICVVVSAIYVAALPTFHQSRAGDPYLTCLNDGWTVVAPGVEPGDKTFKALLGTENGRGAGYMLKDYRTSMPGKAIQAIRVKEDDGDVAMMIDYS